MTCPRDYQQEYAIQEAIARSQGQGRRDEVYLRVVKLLNLKTQWLVGEAQPCKRNAPRGANGIEVFEYRAGTCSEIPK